VAPGSRRVFADERGVEGRLRGHLVKGRGEGKGELA